MSVGIDGYAAHTAALVRDKAHYGQFLRPDLQGNSPAFTPCFRLCPFSIYTKFSAMPSRDFPDFLPSQDEGRDQFFM